jgi:hypothetical protein
MKKTNQKTIFSVAFGMAACLLANGQQQLPASSGRSGSGGGGGGYSSGGERGSVVQVISNPEVLAELSLSGDQQQKVANVLDRVRAIEDELFADLRRASQGRIEGTQARNDQTAKKYQEAHQQLAGATARILALLTPAQKARLQTLCQQAAAGGGGSQTLRGPGQGFARSGGGSGPGRYSGGGGGGSGGGSGGQGGLASGQPGVRVGGSFGGGGSSGGVGGGGGGGAGGSSGSGPTAGSRNEYQSGGGPGGVVTVIANTLIQEQLGLSGPQRQQIAEITGQVRQFEAAFNTDARPSGARLTSTREHFEQRKQKEESTRQAVADAGEEVMRLLTTVQQTRLKEICLQAQGPGALFKPEVIRALGLTATQQVKLASMRQEAERQSAALYRGGDLANVGERLQALQADTASRMISSVLTPAQQTKLEQMKGKEFAGIARFSTGFAGGRGGGSSSSSQSK